MDLGMARADHQVRPRMGKKVSGERYMTPDELEALMSPIFGGYGWQARFGRLVDVTPGSLSRWMTGRNPIPKWVAVMAWALTKLHQQGVPIVDEFRPVSPD